MSADPQMSGDVNLAPPSHAMRWVVIGVLVVVSVVAFLVYNNITSKQDEQKVAKFHQFLATYIEKCNAAAYPKDQQEQLDDDYRTSPGIQAAVDQQLAALNSGASCDSVVAKMKTVDLTLPAPGPAQ